ncbi:MAG: hypothetical protein HYZ49_09500 [Chloroflexi bacterium]|nr:hypothetical protein [Chloroflexota bacterium]
MFNFLSYAGAIERLMSEWYSYSREALQQSTDLGFAREHFVKDVLSSFLPKNIVIGSGEIIDGRGQRSGQQDVIIYRGDFPVITSLTPVNTYLAEGVIAVIEVKSNLSTGEPISLFSAFRSSQKVLLLQKGAGIVNGTDAEVRKLQKLSSIRAYVVGYAGWKDTNVFLEHFRNAGNQVGWDNAPHLIYQPGLCLLQNDGLMDFGNDDGSTRFFLHDEGYAFSVLLHHLLKVIMFNTNGLVVQAQGIDASMRYYLDPYFNFNPPLKFTKLRLQVSGDA